MGSLTGMEFSRNTRVIPLNGVKDEVLYTQRSQSSERKVGYNSTDCCHRRLQPAMPTRAPCAVGWEWIEDPLTGKYPCSTALGVVKWEDEARRLAFEPSLY